MTSRSGAGFAQPPADAFQLEDEEDEDGTAAATLPPPAHVHFASPFAAVASVSRASSVAEDDAESRRAYCRVCDNSGCPVVSHRAPDTSRCCTFAPLASSSSAACLCSRCALPIE